MKKLYSTPDYKEWQRRRLKKIERDLRNNNRSFPKKRSKSNQKSRRISDIKYPVIAPTDLRLIENTEKCMEIFREMRSEDALSSSRGLKFVILDLRNVTQIDYGSISILTAIGDDLKFKKILLRSFLPANIECKNFMIESGYLNNLFDDNGKPFAKTQKSELIFFEKGSGVLSESDNIKISLLVKAVVNHLTGQSKHCLAVKTIILEICGNSIEWSGTDSKQWLLGVKYGEGKVVFTVTDVGKGILETLHRRLSKKFFESFKSMDEILKGAFEKKYGSTTKEVNRNKGLPAVKTHWEQGTINYLKVLTNNVILHFDNESLSNTFGIGAPRFRGTFYQWEMNKECLNKIMV
ncbi:MAG: ATP-binding protein [Bacteroidia bacterium]